ncbi:27120_t:CDS:2, partial [Dentiscutata erythropus]
MDEIDHDIEMLDLYDSISVSGLSSTFTTTNETTSTTTTNETTGTTTINKTNKTTGTSEATSENKSPVWKSFEVLENEPKAKCKYCKKVLSHKKGYRTSHLRRHLKSCLKYQSSVSNGAGFIHPNGQTQLSFNSSVNRLPIGNSNRKNLAYMIIFDKLNFQFVEKQGFCKFVNGILPGNIATCIKADTDNYFITTKLQTITLDNAMSNDVAVSELIRHILQNSIDVKDEVFHNRCLAHILNLIVKDGLKKIFEEIKM